MVILLVSSLTILGPVLCVPIGEDVVKAESGGVQTSKVSQKTVVQTSDFSSAGSSAISGGQVGGVLYSPQSTLLHHQQHHIPISGHYQEAFINPVHHVVSGVHHQPGISHLHHVPVSAQLHHIPSHEIIY